MYIVYLKREESKIRLVLFEKEEVRASRDNWKEKYSRMTE